ncbi:hypothetical protein CJ030_MR6G013301 [Morella rubra]|uniref:Uncharacterized protein n=1 Tax=Morella rubra TaxID=262757 RepID=A0A6A1VFA3_9ROSI|nr:hypothetical protein CJ030_MR6G013301 [Morella rubra]
MNIIQKYLSNVFFYGIRALYDLRLLCMPDTDDDMSTPPTSSALSSPTSVPTLVSSLPHLVTVKLSHENYLLWQAQMIPYLKGQRLYGFVDGSLSPTEFLSTTTPTSTTTSLNPAYTQWVQQDQMILSALISSLTEPLISQVDGYSTSRAVWTALETLFQSQSQARLIHLQYQLATLKKGLILLLTIFVSSKISVILLLLPARFCPPLSSSPISLLVWVPNMTLLCHLLLPDSNRSLLKHLYGHLLSHEIRLRHHASGSSDISANITTKSSSSSPNGARGGRSPGRHGGRGNGQGMGVLVEVVAMAVVHLPTLSIVLKHVLYARSVSKWVTLP